MWILVLFYIVESWRRFPTLLTLQQVLQGSNANNLAYEIVNALFVYDGILEFDLASKLICFGVNKITNFQTTRLVLQCI